MCALYEPLIQHGSGGDYQPCLATHYRTEDDARTWTFKLRTDVTFHNGHVLEAEDVVATLERACDPVLGGKMGTQGVYQSYLEDAAVKAVDSHTVRLVKAWPMSDLLDLLVDIPIVPKRALDDLPDTPVGSGPYCLAEAEDNNLVMKAFRNYWRGEPPVETVYWRAEPDPERRIADLLAHEADIVADVSVQNKRTIEATEHCRVVASQSSLCIIYMCNAQSGVCTNKLVRQALNYALDTPKIIDTLKGGAGRPLNGPLTPSHLGYDPSTSPYGHDPAAARALLAEAGYADGLHLILDVPTSLPDEAPKLAQLMAEQYASVGITTEIKTFPDRERYADMVRAKRIDDACCFDSSPLSTYRIFREKVHSGVRGPWWQGYSNPEVDMLIDQAQAAVDIAVRRALYRRAHRIIRDDAPWIFLYSPIYLWGIGPRARGWTAGIDGLINLVSTAELRKLRDASSC